MVTKKFYITPSIDAFEIDDSDIVATSTPEEDTPDTPETPNTVNIRFDLEREEEGFAD